MKSILPLALILLLASCGMKPSQPQPSDDTISEFPYVDSVTARSYASCATRIDSAAIVEKATELKSRKKLIGFDLDATITQHKTPMTPEATATLDSLGRHYALVMVAAGNAPRVYGQMNQYPIPILANYGMQESDVKDGEFHIIREDTSVPDSAFILDKCNMLRQKYGYTDYKGESVEFHKSGMITFGLLGTEADKQDKLLFDPDKSKRRAMYDEVLQIFGDRYAVYIGGTTSFDLAEKRYNKYDALMRYAQEHGYTKEQVLFVGDDFGDGGGDSHIRLGGMDYIQIYDYRSFPKIMEPLYK